MSRGLTTCVLFLAFGGFFCVRVTGLSLRGSGVDYSHHGQDWKIGQCGSRERQSPIDFSSEDVDGSGQAAWDVNCLIVGSCGVLDFDYPPIEDGFVQVTTNGSWGVDVSGRGNGGVTLHNAYFDVTSVIAHVGSEHTFRGKRLPLEVQLVHKRTDSDHMLVVSVLFDTSPPLGTHMPLAVPAASASLGKLLGGLPGFSARAYAPSPSPASIPRFGRMEVQFDDPQDLLAPLVAGGTFFEYDGSLTSPPCTEQVTWLVRREPLLAFAEDIERVKAQVLPGTGGAGNWRSPMPVMGRDVVVLTARQGRPQLFITEKQPLPEDALSSSGKIAVVGALGAGGFPSIPEVAGYEAAAEAQRATAVVNGIASVESNQFTMEALSGGPSPGPAPAPGR